MAEWLRDLRRWDVSDADFVHSEGNRYSLAAFDDPGLRQLVDLDDPRELAGRALRPSGVATRDRKATRRIATAAYEEGVDGFEWWSTIEASWINVTLFAERAVPKLSLASEPEPLTVDHPAAREAANALGIRLAA